MNHDELVNLLREAAETISSEFGHSHPQVDELNTAADKLERAEPVACPFPCGWDELHSIAVKRAAFIARALDPDELVTEEMRGTVITLNGYLLDIISHMKNYRHPPSAVHDGYVPVPVKPTDEMLDAGQVAGWPNRRDKHGLGSKETIYKSVLAEAYNAMLAAAQQEGE